MAVYTNNAGHIISSATVTMTRSDQTIMLWARRTSDAGGWRRPFGIRNDWELRARNTTMYSDILRSGTAPSLPIQTNEYMHFAFVSDVTNSEKVSYSNGIVGQTLAGVSFSSAQTGRISVLTSSWDTPARWVGSVCDVRIYDRVLSAGEIQTIYATKGNDGIVDGLIHHWPLNSGVENDSASAENDQAGDLHLTTVVGSVTNEFDFGLKKRRRA